MSNLKLYFCLILLIIFRNTCFSIALAQGPVELDQLNKLNQANQLNLKDVNINHWMHLMQYQNSNSSLEVSNSKINYTSKIKAPQFFISSTGSVDPLSELNASIDLFQKKLPASNLHPQCIFPARYQILKKSFKLSDPVSCPDYTDWKEKYDLSSISFLYAGPFMSSPSSVFGHSFLLFGSKKIDEFSQITFNYAADIPSDVSGFDYAYKGLTGGFPGVISILPYYQRLYQYTNIENRDLWEYRLKLNEAEVNLVSDYIWEIKNQVQFNYYFLDENCASILLWIINAIKPDINIKTSNPIYITPVEVTQVIARENLIESVFYHPSLMKRLSAKINLMTSHEKESFTKTLKTKTLFADESNPLLLEALMNHINIERHKNRGVLPDNLKNLERSVLLRRSKNQKAPIEYNEDETPKKPHESHLPMQLQVGSVFQNDSNNAMLSLRPGVHSLLDYEAGYLPHSSIKILELEIQAIQNKKIRLQNLTILNLTNLPSINLYESPLSWLIDIHLKQNDFKFDHEQISGEAKLAGGYTLNVETQDLILYSLASFAVRTNQSRPLGDFELGPQVGLVYSFADLKFESSAAYLWQYSGYEEPVFIKLNSDFTYRLNTEWSFYGGYSLIQDLNKRNKSEWVKIAAQYFF